jgi:hypothetical protein
MARVVDAHATLAGGDTAGAIRRLRSLAPSAPRALLPWYAWEGLAAERITLARLLLARGDHTGAARVAARVDGSQPVVNLLFLHESLALQAEAARRAGDARRANAFRARLARVARDAAPVP